MMTTRKTVTRLTRKAFTGRKTVKLIMQEADRLISSGALPIGDGKTSDIVMANAVLYIAIKNVAETHYSPSSDDLKQLTGNLGSF